MNRPLPGTVSNFERSGDRDLYWSMMLRFPHDAFKYRSLDIDSSPIGSQVYCNRCRRPGLLMESVREWVDTKFSYITEQQAADQGCDAYVVQHSGKWVPSRRMDSKEDCLMEWDKRFRSPIFNIQARPSGLMVAEFRADVLDAEEEFLLWIEGVMSQHVCLENKTHWRLRCQKSS